MALVRPHGGRDLNPLLLEGRALADESKRAHSLPQIKVSSREKGDLIMLGIGGILATMNVTEKYTIDKAHECAMVFKTTDPEHPGVKMVMEQSDINLAGPVKVLSQSDFPEKYGDLFMTPAQTRELFVSYGWSKVAAFQTRNPMHPSHEYLAQNPARAC